MDRNSLLNYFKKSTFRGREFSAALEVGDLTVRLRTTAVPGGNASTKVRSYFCEAMQGTEGVFMAVGFAATPVMPVTADTFFDAVDSLGEEESGAMLDLLLMYGVERLVRDKTLLVGLTWESSTPEIAALIFDAIARHVRTKTVAVTADPFDWDFRPRPEAPAEEHPKYRAALLERLAIVRKVIAKMQSDGLYYTTPYARTHEEELYDLACRFA